MAIVISKIVATSAGKMMAIAGAIVGLLYGLALAAFSFIFQGLLGSIGNLSSISSGAVSPASPFAVPASIPGSLASLGSFPNFPIFGSSPIFGLLGIAAIVALPILFAILGFLAGVFGALAYNFLAPKVGGIEVELTDKGAAQKEPK